MNAILTKFLPLALPPSIGGQGGGGGEVGVTREQKKVTVSLPYYHPPLTPPIKGGGLTVH